MKPDASMYIPSVAGGNRGAFLTLGRELSFLTMFPLSEVIKDLSRFLCIFAWLFLRFSYFLSSSMATEGA